MNRQHRAEALRFVRPGLESIPPRRYVASQVIADAMTEETKPTADSTAPAQNAPSKPRRLRTRLLALCAAGLAIFLVFEWAPWEPRHGGKRLGKWLEQLKYGDEPEREQASHALLAIGPEAAPGLARILVEGDSPLNRRYEAWVGKLPKTVRGALPRSNQVLRDNRAQAYLTLIAMGEAAMPAWPILLPTLLHTNGPRVFGVTSESPAQLLFYELHPDDPETVNLLLDAAVWSEPNQWAHGYLSMLMRRNREVADRVTPRLAKAAIEERKRQPRRPDCMAQFHTILRCMPRGQAESEGVLEMLEHAAGQLPSNESLEALFTLWTLAPEQYSERIRAEEIARLLQSPNSIVWGSAMSYVVRFHRPNDSKAAMIVAKAILEKLRSDPGITNLGLEVLADMGTNAAPLDARIRNVVNPMIGGTDEFDRILAIETLWATTRDKSATLPLLLKDLEEKIWEKPEFYYLNRSPGDIRLFNKQQVRLSVLRVLEQMGPAAIEAAPRLRTLADLKDPELRHAAGLALWRVANEPDHLLDAFKDQLKTELASPQSWKLAPDDELFPLLEELDAHAKPLVPLLVQLAEHPYTLPMTRERTIEVLQKIAPESLDRIDKEILERCLRYINWKREFEANHGWN